MDEQEYWHRVLEINTLNLAANLQNVCINRQILESSKRRDAVIVGLLGEIRDELRRGNYGSE